MKTSFFKLSFIFLFLAIGYNSNAQVGLEWDSYGIGFSVPDDFELFVNNSEEFSAGNDDVYLSLLPWDDENINEYNLAEAVVDVAYAMDYDEITQATDANIHDFVGYGVSGVKDGVWAVIVMLLDEKSGTNLVVVIAYNDGYDRTAQAIYDSIYAYDD
jgi:hypothetical protein